MQRQKLGFSMSTGRNTQGKQSVTRHRDGAYPGLCGDESGAEALGEQRLRMAHTPDCAGTRARARCTGVS